MKKKNKFGKHHIFFMFIIRGAYAKYSFFFAFSFSVLFLFKYTWGQLKHLECLLGEFMWQKKQHFEQQTNTHRLKLVALVQIFFFFFYMWVLSIAHSWELARAHVKNRHKKTARFFLSYMFFILLFLASPLCGSLFMIKVIVTEKKRKIVDVMQQQWLNCYDHTGSPKKNFFSSSK